jgi:multicomponent K+:H+ antiporter subunit E
MRTFFVVLALWLILNESLAFGHWILGSAIGLLAVGTLSRLQGGRRRGPRRPVKALRLLAVVIADIARSNVAVARIVLGLRAPGRVSGFLPVPLTLRDPAGLATLACIVTATPGTSWVRYDQAEDRLTLHVLDLVDPDEMVRTFRQRYEKPLMEIFE